MTDVQLLISIRVRASKRFSNFQFVSVLNELEKQARERMLECQVMEKLIEWCKIYHITLDDTDIACINQPRPIVIPKEFLIRLIAAGFKVSV